MDKDKYTCAVCKNTYEKGWSDEESEKEMKENWGNIPKEDRAIICDDCYKKRTPEEVKEMGKEYQELSEKEIKELHEDIECTDTQNHLKECKKCSPSGEWEKEFDEKFRSFDGHSTEHCPAFVGNGKCDCSLPDILTMKLFISKVAKVERGKYPEGYQGEE